MSVYLTLGKATNGELLDINSQVSGRCELVCPFCEVPLIAVKGQQKQHHFRHDGDTCNESLNQLPKIDGWDHFHLSVPQEYVDLLIRNYNPKAKNPKLFNHHGHYELEDYELIKRHEWMGHYEFTDRGLIVLGALPLPRFSQWIRSTLKSRFNDISTQVKSGYKHKAHRDIEAYRQQNILNTSLYLFEYTQPDGKVFYKVGRTSRDPIIRLQETITDIKSALTIAVRGKVLRIIKYAGYVEQFALYKYKGFKMNMGSHQEYLSLDPKAVKNIKSEFTRLSNAMTAFDKDEQFIVTGRWQYEDRRLANAKKGIELTLKNGGSFGRPKGTSLSEEKFLSKHSDIVNVLNQGTSINNTVDRTGKSRSTVKRVKKLLD